MIVDSYQQVFVKTIGKVRRLSRPSSFVCDARQLKRYTLSDGQPVMLGLDLLLGYSH